MTDALHLSLSLKADTLEERHGCSNAIQLDVTGKQRWTWTYPPRTCSSTIFPDSVRLYVSIVSP